MGERLITMTSALLLLLAGCQARSAVVHHGNASKQSGGPTIALSTNEAITRINALEPPAGVAGEVFTPMKSRLEHLLLISGKPHFASAVPGPGGAVGDLLLTGGSSTTLHWTYVNPGDYDLNRQVNISDLAPLGKYFGQCTCELPFWDENTIEAVIDGIGDGEINILDVNPIGDNFLATVDGYLVQQTSTPADASSWVELAQVPFEQASANAVNALDPRLRFNFVVAAPAIGTSYRVLPFHGPDVGPASNEVQFRAGPPHIDDVQPKGGLNGQGATFATVLSGGTPESIVWDFGGGGFPDDPNAFRPVVGLIGNEFGTSSYNASVTVTNASGSDTFSFTLDVEAFSP